MKKMLIVATVPSMIGQFNMNNISILLELGYTVHVACDWNDRSVWTTEKINALKEQLNNLEIKYYQIDYSRSIFCITKHLKSYKQTLDLVSKNQYDFIHCHTPIASVIARLVCKKTNTKCVYTAHGFHFFKGAPLKNWMIFYPIEKWLSKYTDVLITINKEDYKRAKSNFKMKKLEYIPGVGVDVAKIQSIIVDKEKKKEELGIDNNRKILISVGELSERKNHKIIIEAIAGLENITYIICGQGTLKQQLLDFAKKKDVDLKLLGFREDRLELIKISDIFVFPSLQEGLPVALMEAMACETLCVASDIRGNNDLIKDNENGFLCNRNDYKQYSTKIVQLFNDAELRRQFIDFNKVKIKKYDGCEIKKLMLNIYSLF
ncbi:MULTISPECIES: glycosyltransferase [Thomasclavelia]|uniref:glycosyltransferase n=1 Tax=Thomasclavelia TaxID=3025755 RepID=UPI00320978F1